VDDLAVGRRLGAALLVALTATTCRSAPASSAVARQRAADTRRLAREAGLPAPVGELLARYAASVGKTFSVTYDLGQGQALAVWQRPPRRRVDAESQRVYGGPDGSFACAHQADQQWRCLPTDTDASLAGPLDPGAVTAAIDALRAGKGAFTFRTEQRVIARTRADCIVSEPVTPGAGTGATLCLSPDGAVLLGAGALGRAVRYTTKVSARDVRLPAPPPD
jgi:hypothetical protein